MVAHESGSLGDTVSNLTLPWTVVGSGTAGQSQFLGNITVHSFSDQLIFPPGPPGLGQDSVKLLWPELGFQASSEAQGSRIPPLSNFSMSGTLQSFLQGDICGIKVTQTKMKIRYQKGKLRVPLIC